jgi:hypothetical protein
MMKKFTRARKAHVVISFDIFARMTSFLQFAVIELDKLVYLEDGTSSRQLGSRHRP